METAARVEIRMSKSKVLALGAGSAMFVLMALWLLGSGPDRFEHLGLLGDPMVVHATGWFGFLFFGATGAFAAVKYFDTRPGLVFDQRGITDHSSGLAIGFVPWHDVAGVKEYEVMNQPMMIVLLKDQQRYLERIHPLLRWIARMNVNLCGSCIAISANTMQMDHAALKALLESQWARHKPQ
jgi:hypothetical protein